MGESTHDQQNEFFSQRIAGLNFSEERSRLLNTKTFQLHRFQVERFYFMTNLVVKFVSNLQLLSIGWIKDIKQKPRICWYQKS
jgi:hypothetical protein